MWTGTILTMLSPSFSIMQRKNMCIFSTSLSCNHTHIQILQMFSPLLADHAIRQRQAEKCPSQDTQCRSGPADEQGGTQFIPDKKHSISSATSLHSPSVRQKLVGKKIDIYFCATNMGSKNSDVILWAYREQALREHRPARNNRHKLGQYCVIIYILVQH